MKHFAFILFAIFFLSRPVFGIIELRMGNSKQEQLSSAPKLKAVNLQLQKQKSEIQISEETSFLLEISALRPVSDVTVKLKFSRGLKSVDANRKIKIARIDSGKTETISISAIASERSLQNISIEVSGVMRNPFTNADVNFRTGEEVGMLYNEQTKTFIIETSYETMTNSYRIWNLVPEDTLLARGHSIVFKDQIPDKNFIQADPLIPEIKKRKSLNHKTYFTQMDYNNNSSNAENKIQMNKQLSPNGTQSTVCVTVNGSFFYEASDGQYVPLANATVEIWEDDTFSDDYITSTTTDQNGHFSVYLCDNDGIFDSHLELYAIAATANDRVRVLNYTQPGGPYGFNSFAWSTWIIETGGGTIDYGNLLISNGTMNRGGAKIFDNMQKAWSASVAKGFNPSYTPIVYPSPTSQCGGSSCYSYQTFPGTSLGVIYMQTEEWINGNEDVSYHEYGHALMHRAYSNEWYPNTGGGDHEVFPQPAGFAWSEGWATFYTQIVQNDGYYKWWADLENKNNIYNSTFGEVNEWRVAQALVDLYDTNVDGNDQGSLAYNRFISTMQSNNSSSLTEFWGQLKNILSPWEKYYGSMSLIYNTISVAQDPYPVLSATISGPTYLNPRQSGTWTATTSGGTAPYHYQWWYMHPSTTIQLFSIIEPNNIPVDVWFTIGTDSPILSIYDSQNFNLKCVVTDATNTQVTSNIISVSVGGSLAKISGTGEEKVDDILALAEELPTEYSLGNYPNPFNPTTKIGFSIPNDSHVSLKVFDILGREVAVLANQAFSAGRYEFDFNASILPSGTYIYSLRTDSKTIIKKMLLVK